HLLVLLRAASGTHRRGGCFGFVWYPNHRMRRSAVAKGGAAMNKPKGNEKLIAYIAMGVVCGLPLIAAALMAWFVAQVPIAPVPACFPTSAVAAAVIATAPANGSNAAASNSDDDGALPMPCSTDAGELQRVLQAAASSGHANPHIKHITFIGNNQVKVMLDGNRAATIGVPLGSIGDLYKLATAAGVSNSADTPSMFANLFSPQMMVIVILMLITLLPMLRMQAMGGQGRAMAFGKSRHRKVEYPSVTFDDVEGIDEAKEELDEIVRFLKDPEAAGRLGGRVPKGALLVGGPGVGKTLV